MLALSETFAGAGLVRSSTPWIAVVPGTEILGADFKAIRCGGAGYTVVAGVGRLGPTGGRP
ncbi:hypothetical protein GCM10023195_87180 [Actinoallomurus liliacearum]|uniref:Uncharacterized protein n=1 Tax=Actinoallomurus liliacearum TaxID=1080073 RepID=A0ABP8U180_9ACTN